MPSQPRRLAAIGLALGASLALSACEPPASNAPSSGPGGVTAGKRLGCTIPTFTHPFFVAMKKGLEDAAAAGSATINVVDGQDKAQTQLDALDIFVVEKVDAVILCPTEVETLAPGVEKVHAAGIPVITVNRKVASDSVVSYIGADDRQGGEMQGQALIEARPKGARIVLLQGILGSSPQRDREAGLEAALKGKAGYEIVQKVPYDFQRRMAVEKVQTLLLQFPKGKLDVIVAQSDDGALAAADICQREGRTEITIIGFNGESDAFDYIRAGKIEATILQDAETQGRVAVEHTLKHLGGEKLKPIHYTPLYIIRKKNIDEHKPAWQSAES